MNIAFRPITRCPVHSGRRRRVRRASQTPDGQGPPFRWNTTQGEHAHARGHRRRPDRIAEIIDEYHDKNTRTIGAREDGDRLTSCVHEPIDVDTSSAIRRSRGQSLTAVINGEAHLVAYRAQV